MSIRFPGRAGRTLLLVSLVLVVGCAAGNVRFDEEPAGFFMGLWHGIILVIAFVISLFNDSVQIYEVHNSGALYNLGFVLGATACLGGGAKVRKKRRRREDHDQLEEKIKTAIRSWLDETGRKDPEWQEIGEKVQEKVKREIRKWAEKED